SRKGGAAPRALEHLHVRELTIEDGRATYVDNGAQPVMLDAINLKVTDFNISSPFEVELELAALSDSRNVAFSGHIGPLVNQAGVINPGDVSLYLQGSVGPIALDDLRKVALAAQAIPPALSIAAPVTMDATVNGRLDNFALDVKSDLSANAIAFDDRFNKPAGTPLTFLLTASHEATGPFLVPRAVELTLADLSARASNLELGAGKIAGRIDSNQFEIDSVTKLAPAAAKLGISGKAEIHSDLSYANGHESAKGKVALAGVAVTRPGTNAAALSNLSGDIVLDGQSADFGPLKFSLGSGAATLTAHASSLSPLSLDYQFSAATLRPADFVAKRPADEHLNQVSSKGTVAIRPSGPAVSSQLSSTSGTVNGVAYQNLALTASLDGHTLRLPALQLAAFGGSIAASGETQTVARAPFSTAINFSNVDLQQLLASQNSKAADSVRGIATGQAQVSGRTGSFEEMQPTLNGNGRLAVVNGKLIGINVAADGLKKVNNLPGIGSLIPAPVVANHPELFKNPDTDIDHMSLSFVLHGARVTSNDIVVKSQDYTVLGDGWFELNKRLNMSVKLQLSPPFSRELVQQKKAIGYLTNRSGQVDVPMQISGTLPKPLVVPDVAELAQRAATHAVESQGQKALGKLFGKKGASKFLGGIFGGDAH
ncbi:MAG TPA: AsmA-like C-terminal region-containing protein, partial [Candidatus Binataceae bacterium]|nr:AsmA-like C-terminal region-containing protein [Candidatus Binataceae bacterium]